MERSQEPGVGTAITYQPGEMPLPARPTPGLRSTNFFHQEMSREAASSSSQLKAAVPAKGARGQWKI